MEILEKLRSLNQSNPDPTVLPTEDAVKNAEEKLGVEFPPSYVKYQLECADITFGLLEMYSLLEDGSYLDLLQAVKDARHYHALPEHLLPFVAEQDGDYQPYFKKATYIPLPSHS